MIYFHWQDEDTGDRIHGSDRDTIKTHVVNLMLSSPQSIQKQLSQAIAIIGQHDFPDKWTGLIPEMVSKFQTGDFNIINGVLQTAFSIFEKYSYEMKSQKLWTEVSSCRCKITCMFFFEPTYDQNMYNNTLKFVHFSPHCYVSKFKGRYRVYKSK